VWGTTAGERLQQRRSSETREREGSQINESRESHTRNVGTSGEEQGIVRGMRTTTSSELNKGQNQLGRQSGESRGH
jgi:hypothetical protein